MRDLYRVECSALLEHAGKNTREYCTLAEVRIMRKGKAVLDTDLSVRANEVRQPSNDQLLYFGLLVECGCCL